MRYRENPECPDGDLIPDRLVVYAKGQPQYIPLPAMVSSFGLVTTKWKLTWRDRMSMLLGKHLYLQILTHGDPLHPVKLSIGPDGVK